MQKTWYLQKQSQNPQKLIHNGSTYSRINMPKNVERHLPGIATVFKFSRFYYSKSAIIIPVNIVVYFCR